MDDIKKIWLYLEPSVFISEDKQSCLFYNANTHKSVLFKKNETINNLVIYLQNPDNMYSILININDLDGNDDLYDFIVSLQEAGCGDIIEGELPKPVILPPLLNLQKSVERLKKNNIPTGDKITSYLHEVTIYVNGDCQYNCNGCQHRFRQMPFCTKSENTLDFDVLNNFLSSIAYTNANINITGGNPFQYPKLYELLDELGKRLSLQTFIVNYRNIPEDLTVLYIFTSPQFKLDIVVDDSFEIDTLISVATKLQQGKINQLWKISIASESEYERAEQLLLLLSEHDIKAEIKPLYINNNLSFFEENIFISQDDILGIALDRQNIFALQMLNTNDFGKLVILSDGKIYANVNHNPVGSIYDPISDILVKELETGQSWRNTRYNVTPCSKCCFKLLCPSPSNYEIVIRKPNLCHIM
jgi:pseudo-rSAM protein